MTTTVNVQQAKTNLSALLRRVEAGEEIVIARAGSPIARIHATSPPRRNLQTALLPELPPISVDGLFDDLPEEELSAWEADDPSDPLSES